jgi:hypothetical protein
LEPTTTPQNKGMKLASLSILEARSFSPVFSGPRESASEREDLTGLRVDGGESIVG